MCFQGYGRPASHQNILLILLGLLPLLFLREHQAFLTVQNKGRLRKDLRKKSQMLIENDEQGAKSHPIPPDGDGHKDGLKIAEDTLEKTTAAAVHAWGICSLRFFLPWSLA